MNAVAEATYRQRIQRAIDYTEENLTRGVSLKEAADAACWSPYHFMRTFHAMTGLTYAEYVRDRRLETAAYRLAITRDRILDIAMDVGYETQEAFTRAFKRGYGSSPGQYRVAGAYRMRRSPITVDGPGQVGIPFDEGAIMNPAIRQYGPINIIGAALRTRDDGTNFKEIPLFWKQFLEEKTFDKISGKVDPDVSFGICTDADEETGDFSYVIGCEVAPGTVAPDGLGVFTIPAATYAVFTASEEWERADGPDFELYDEARCGEISAECDIYIPVTRKQQ